MAGYYLCSLDWPTFQQLVTEPTREQALVLAVHLLKELDDYFDDFDNEEECDRWPQDRDALATVIAERLVKPDWWSDLSDDGKAVWDCVMHSLSKKPGKRIGIDFKLESDGLYWDAVDLAAGRVDRHGRHYPRTDNVEELSAFGRRPFRYAGKRGRRSRWDPMHSIHTPEQVKKLLNEAEACEPVFRELTDQETAEQYFTALLKPLKKVASQDRLLWVQTST